MSILRLLISITVRLYPVGFIRGDHAIAKAHGKAGTKKRKVAQAEILTGSLHKSQLKAREAFTSKTDLKSVQEAYQARTKKPKCKRSPTNSCIELNGTKIVKHLGNTASDDVNRAAENPICS